jgi:hypothetical protein
MPKFSVHIDEQDIYIDSAMDESDAVMQALDECIAVAERVEDDDDEEVKIEIPATT